MSGLGESNSDILVLVQRAQNKALKIINFKEERLPSEPLFTETKILNLTNIITLNNYMLVFDHLIVVLQLCLFICLYLLTNNIVTIPWEQGDVLNIPKMKTSFYGSTSVQVKSIKDWNNIIDKIHFTTEDFMKRSEVIKTVKNTLP